MKKITSLFTAFVMVALILAMPVLAASVPEHLKTDYTPATDGNMVTTYPTNFVDINSGEVSCPVSENIVTMIANSTVLTSSDWGMQGFELNERFIPTLKDGYGPEFAQSTKLLFSAKVRKAQDATANAKINVSYSSWYKVQYENGTPQYTDTYPAVGAGFDVTSTEWTEFRAVMTVPANSDGNTWAFLLGLANGTAQGAKVEVDMASIYVGAEMAHDLNLTATSDTMSVASPVTVKAEIVNQADEVFSGAQGTFTWYVLTEDKNAFAEGISISDNGNNTATVSATETAETGTYHIVAVSDTYGDFVKSAKIKVKSFPDYVPKDKKNLITTYPTTGNLNINVGEVSATALDNIATISTSIVSTGNPDHALQGFLIDSNFIPSLTDTCKAPAFTTEEKVLFSAKVRKVQGSTDAKINVAYGIPGSGLKDAWHYPDNCATGFDVTSTEWTEFNAIITPRETIGGNQYWQVIFGFHGGTPEGASVEIDMSSLYLGAEEQYDIINQPLGDSVVEAGTESTLSYKAQIVNQIGIPGTISQGTFEWFVMNEDKTAFADKITVTPQDDNTATVKVSADAAVGIYKIVAQSQQYPDFLRSCSLTVMNESFVHEIYVSPDGDDNDTGTISLPLRTAQAAQNLARQYVADGKLPVHVIFRGGDYRFENSFTFGPEDSGNIDKPVTYRAFEGETVRFKGSKPLDLSKASRVTDSDVLNRVQENFRKQVRVIDLSEQGITSSQICEPAEGSSVLKLDYNREFNGFYINGKPMDVSCWPNGGDEAAYTYNENDAVNKFTYIDSAPDKWQNAKNWWVNIFQMYDYIPLRLKAASVDAANNVIHTGSNGGRLEVTIANPYTPTWKAYNLLEEMDIPGEYHIDVDNMKLYFLPPCDLNGATAELDVIGDPVMKLQNAENITFQGIEFAQINDDGVVMTDVNNIDVKECTFRDIGFRGLAVVGTEEPKTVQYATGDKFPYGAAANEVPTANNASYNMDITDNVFYNTGSSAIHINGGNIDTLTPSKNVVANNFISKFSQNVHWDGVVVAGVGTKVQNNHISDAPYYAIRSYGNDHVIEYNEVYDVIKNSNDAAAIYSGASSIARGSVIQYNYLHDLKTWKDTKNDWEYGVYLDDCQQGHTVRYNIITDVHEGTMSNGAGNYTFEGNTVVNTSLGMKFGYNANAVPSASVRTDVENRIYDKDLYYAKYPALSDYVDGVSPKKSSVVRGNIFSGVSKMFQYASKNSNDTFKLFSQENDVSFSSNESVNSDIFVNPQGKDYRIKNAYASQYPYALNESFDIGKIGMSTNLTLNNSTAPFALLYPANGATAVGTDNVWLSWENAFGASRYQVVVATDASFAETIYNGTVPYSALNLSAVATLNVDTTYYWKVTAINPSKDFGAEWQSAVGSFTTISTSIENIELTDGTVTADIYTYGNTITDAVDAVCYLASYSAQNELIEVVSQEIVLEPNKKYTYSENLPNFVEANTSSAKLLVWTKGYIPVTCNATIIIPINKE